MTPAKKKSDVSITLLPLLVSAKDAAMICGVSAKYWRMLDNKGGVPSCVKGFGKRKLWSVVELDKWISAGCPIREKWGKIKNG